MKGIVFSIISSLSMTRATIAKSDSRINPKCSIMHFPLPESQLDLTFTLDALQLTVIEHHHNFRHTQDGQLRSTNPKIIEHDHDH